MAAILREEPPSLSLAGKDVPHDLEKIVTRCLRKDRARRFQTMADLKVALEEVKEELGRLAAAPAAAVPRRPWLLYAGLALAVATVGVFWWRSRTPAPGASAGLTLRQLTQDSGRTTQPALSPDGRLVAYASDRAGDGMDIWVQQLTPGSQPIRLTRHAADDDQPSFSPDGGHVVFRSGRDGEGVYVMPALGGEERLLSRGPSRQPRFSPDGQFVALSNVLAMQSSLLIVPVAGGAPRRMAEDFYVAMNPVWSADGAKILFAGQRQQGEPPDWWVASLDGGAAVKTGATAVLEKFSAPVVLQSLGAFPLPQEWIDDRVLFAAGDLWRLPLSARDYKPGIPERLTTSAGNETAPRAIRGPQGWRIIFAAGQSAQSLWSLPLDLNAGKALGEPAKLFADGLPRSTPSLSSDGSRLVYLFQDLEGFGMRLRDTKTGSETTLARSKANMRARISPDGSTVAYNLSGTDEKETVMYLVSAAGADTRKLCETCGLMYDWTPDGKRILYRTGNPMRFLTVEIATGQKTEVLAHPRYGTYNAVYSPDQRWMAVTYGGVGAPQSLFVAPVEEDGAARPQSEWITIAERAGASPRPWWSPSGSVLYYLSAAGGKNTIWARRLDPKTKQPRGEPFVIYSPPAERSVPNSHNFGPALGAGRLLFPITESTGNIWFAE
jgi:Tol biopolymer transport system component